MSRALPPLRCTGPAVLDRAAVLPGGTSSGRGVSLDSGRNVLDEPAWRALEHTPDGVPA